MSLPNRQSLRLPHFDYSSAGWYFVTICTKDRTEFFGRIVNDKMVLNPTGQIVFNCWYTIPDHFENIRLDAFVIMPNHVHGIVVIDNNKNNDNPPVGAMHAWPDNWPDNQARHASPLRDGHAPPKPPYQILPVVIGSFKSSVTRLIRNSGFAWQRSYYDHIIRNEKSLDEIRQYIRDNPLKWGLDEYCSNQ